MAWKKWRTGDVRFSPLSCFATLPRPNWHSDEAIVWKAELILAQLGGALVSREFNGAASEERDLPGEPQVRRGNLNLTFFIKLTLK